MENLLRPCPKCKTSHGMTFCPVCHKEYTEYILANGWITREDWVIYDNQKEKKDVQDT